MRVHKAGRAGRFLRLPNATARDDRLSYRARGLLAELLSRPDGWGENADAITARGKAARGPAAESRRAIRAAMAELIAAGYLRRVPHPAPGGRWATDLHAYDRPTESTPGGTPARPGQTDVPAGCTEVPPTDTPAGGTSNRRKTRPHIGRSYLPPGARLLACPACGGREDGGYNGDTHAAGCPRTGQHPQQAGQQWHWPAGTGEEQT